MALDQIEERLFSEVALEWEMTDAVALAQARDRQRTLLEEGREKKLSDVLVGMNVLSRPQAQKILKEMRRRLGQKPMIAGFEIQQKVGHGAMGVVYRARQVSMDREVAIKLLPRQFAEDDNFVQRFLREARTSARLNHPNIVAAIDAGEGGGHYYFAMEYVDGQPLNGLLQERGRIPEREVVEMALQVVAGLRHAAENNITHRDIKPANLMAMHDGTIKITDMGLALVEAPDGTSDGIHVPKRAGTPYYMAPEQVEGEGPFDTRTDFYALGATMYELATGIKPFAGGGAHSIMLKRLEQKPPLACETCADISFAFSSVILKLMQPTREGRYQTADEIEADLVRLLNGKRPKSWGLLPPDYRTGPVLNKVPRISRVAWTSRHSKVLLIAGGIAFFLGVAGMMAPWVVGELTRSEPDLGPRPPEFLEAPSRSSSPYVRVRPLWEEACAAEREYVRGNRDAASVLERYQLVVDSEFAGSYGDLARRRMAQIEQSRKENESTP